MNNFSSFTNENLSPHLRVTSYVLSLRRGNFDFSPFRRPVKSVFVSLRERKRERGRFVAERREKESGAEEREWAVGVDVGIRCGRFCNVEKEKIAGENLREREGERGKEGARSDN